MEEVLVKLRRELSNPYVSQWDFNRSRLPPPPFSPIDFVSVEYARANALLPF